MCASCRVDISDTLMYVYEMLGAELLSNLYDKLGRLLTNAEQPTSWQVGETQTSNSSILLFYYIIQQQLFIPPGVLASFWKCVL